MKRFFQNTATLLALLILAGCTGTEETATDEAQDTRRAVRVETLELQPTTFEDEIRITGTIDAPDDAVLSAQSSGTLTSLTALGSYVKAGQTVAQVDAGLARAGLQQAQAQVAVARSQFDLAADNLKRQEGLYRDSIISALEFENIRAQHAQTRAGLAQAQAAQAQAQQQLSNTRIVAPFSGAIEEHLVERGEQVNPGTEIVRVVSAGRVQVEAGVPERYAGDIAVGTAVQVRLSAYALDVQRGKVTFAGAAINPDSRTFPIEVALDNPGGKLKPEMIAQLTVTREKLTNVLVVPQAAVVRDEEGDNVFIIEQGAEATAARRAVTLGPTSNGKVVITSGLAAGESIVVLGQNNLTTDDVVEVVDTYTSADAADTFTDASTR